MRSIIIFTILMISTSCAVDKIDKTTFNIDLYENSPSFVFTDSVFSNVNYVQLESTDESMIVNISKLTTSDDKVYILDKTQDVILVFYNTGKFYGKISKKGRGPGEYIKISDYCVDDNNVYITSSTSPEGILVYDKKSLQFKSHIAQDVQSFRISVNKDFVVSCSGNNAESLKDITIINKSTGKTIDSYRDLNKEKTGWSSSLYCLNSSDNDIYGSFPYDYNIYKLNKSGLSSIISFDFGKNNMMPGDAKNYSYQDMDAYLKSLPNRFIRPIQGFSNICVTDKYICAEFTYYGVNHLVVYSKNLDEILFCGNIITPKEAKMPLNGNFRFANNNGFIFSMDALFVKELLQNNHHSTIPDNLKNIKPSDNPIIIIYNI